MRSSGAVWSAAILLGLTPIAGCGETGLPPAAELDNAMVEVPAGEFLMGNDAGPSRERPERTVYLDGFAIDRFEVTVGQYRRFVAEGGGDAPGSWGGGVPPADDYLPVQGVIWDEAAAYCDWLGKRLPTEAEWEKAARGTDGRRWPWGDQWRDGIANTPALGLPGPWPVGAHPEGAGPYGAEDMAGNLAEWVADFYDADYYGYAPDRNPTGPAVVTNRVLRGGAFALAVEWARTTARTSSHSASPDLRVGFRCASDLAARPTPARAWGRRSESGAKP